MFQDGGARNYWLGLENQNQNLRYIQIIKYPLGIYTSVMEAGLLQLGTGDWGALDTHVKLVSEISFTLYTWLQALDFHHSDLEAISPLIREIYIDLFIFVRRSYLIRTGSVHDCDCCTD